MKTIEIRLWVAYGLIAIMLAAVVATVAYMRHNRPSKRYHRRRTREDLLLRERNDAVDDVE